MSRHYKTNVRLCAVANRFNRLPRTRYRGRIFTLVLILALPLLLIQVPSIFCSETDSFTDRCAPLEDTTDYLSAFVTRGIEKAVTRANHATRKRYLQTNYPFRGKQGVDYCNSEDLYRQIRVLFARKFIGQMEAHVNRLPEGMIRHIELSHSVYRDFPLKKAPTLVGTGNLGAAVNIGKHIVGADKFGHFFSEGWTTYKVAYQKPVPDFDAAVEYGIITESLYYGVMTTGVFSHADLVANFNGMRFFNAMTGDGVDPLGPEALPEPYVKCLNKKWARVRDFNWTNYVDAAWDEGVNFNDFKDKELLNFALDRMEQALRSRPDDCDCDGSNSQADLLPFKYKGYADRLLNLQNPKVLPESLHPENLIRAKIQHLLVHRQQP